MERIDLDMIEKSVMKELKDFQRDTVYRINQLFTEYGQDRILVSDEVGLGKTLIARGTIAKFAKWRKELGYDLVKVIYVCSNATIADQNLEKLRLTDEIQVDRGSNSRLSMQHLNIFRQENDEKIKKGFIQLIPLTPSTSFEIDNRTGKYEERALILSILLKIPKFKDYSNELTKILKQHKKNTKEWESKVSEYSDEIDECDHNSEGEYLKYMKESLLNDKNKFFIDDLIDYCEGGKFEDFKNKEIVVNLRKIFADISLEKLNPDLIIMDEFQRFNDLLNHKDENESTKLADKFFKSDNVKILMLSATPFKLYSSFDEIDENNPNEFYEEFLNVIEFLNEDNFENFNKILSDYYLQLMEYNGDNTSVLRIKSKVEDELYKNICRTERITERRLEDLFEDCNSNGYLSVQMEDIESYIQFQKLLEGTNLGNKLQIDYIKSSPYLLSFMKSYKLKEGIEEYFKDHSNEIYKLNKELFWIKKTDIQNYNEISYNNARLTNLIGHVLKEGVEKLLWIPPSLPYYDSRGIFNDFHNFSKTLIFSSWEMVPRMISSIISYEIERKTIGKLKSDSDYFSDNRYPSERLTFKYEESKPKQMFLLNFIYPSKYLTDIFNPVDCLNNKLSLENLEKQITQEIDEKLETLNKFECLENDEEDSDWYFLAPLLLDSLCSTDYSGVWFRQIDNIIDEYDNDGLRRHFNNFETHYRKFIMKKAYEDNSIFDNRLGKKPDDLSKVLCDVALASPAICINRIYQNELNGRSNEYINKLVLDFSLRFIRYFNSTEATAVIDSYDGSDREYWRKVLTYSKEGNIQAVLDEYVHILLDGLHLDNIEKIKFINKKIIDSMHLYNAKYEIDTFDDFKLKIENPKHSPKSLRTHYAVSFIQGVDKDEDKNRKRSVLSSFNSPFWPFILTSTSIGQEGLDFHQYCRRIVHWNLPSNAIDLEQREGRINRFKSLAIRQNIAKRYCGIEFTQNIWNELFEEALEKEKHVNSSELIPYWGLTYRPNMIKIERIVPMYPYSKDIAKFNRLQHILASYRLTLGQPYQDYLIDSLSEKMDKNIDKKKFFINLSPFYKNLKKGQTKLDMFENY